VKKLLPLLVALVLGYVVAGRGSLVPEPSGGSPAESVRVDRSPGDRVGREDAVAAAFDRRQSNVQVEAAGEVERVLPDDTNGSRHQRIIVRLPSGQTVLIAHNIDLAPRVDRIQAGDAIAFSGEYEWNPQGGVIHWTHRDPAGQHVAGWLDVAGRRYQ